MQKNRKVSLILFSFFLFAPNSLFAQIQNPFKGLKEHNNLEWIEPSIHLFPNSTGGRFYQFDPIAFAKLKLDHLGFQDSNYNMDLLSVKDSAAPPFDWIVSVPHRQQDKEPFVFELAHNGNTRGLSSKMKSLQECGNDVHVSLERNRQRYFLGENILLKLVVRNYSKVHEVNVRQGGDYRGTGRAYRLKVTAWDENGNRVPDPLGQRPYSSHRGGFVMDRQLSANENVFIKVPLLKYCFFSKPGRYNIKVYHDLGWDKAPHFGGHDNELPNKAAIAPVLETIIELVEPDVDTAGQLLAEMLKLPDSPQHRWGEDSNEYYDLSLLRHPHYAVHVIELLHSKPEMAKEIMYSLSEIGTIEASQALIDLLELASEPEMEKHFPVAYHSRLLEAIKARMPVPQPVHFKRYRKFDPEQKNIKNYWNDELTEKLSIVGQTLTQDRLPGMSELGKQVLEMLK